MKICIKCNKEFTPQKGLINFCSLSCRNSRKQTEEINNKRSKTLKLKKEISTNRTNALKLAYKEGRKKLIFNNEHRKKSIKSRIKNIKEKPFEQWGRKLQERLILEEQNNRCLLCNNTREWISGLLTFELDHIDGDRSNNKRENLRILCPNCHSTTPTWRGRGGNKKLLKKNRIKDEEILEEIKKTKNIRQILLALELKPNGANFYRVKKLINCPRVGM